MLRRKIKKEDRNSMWRGYWKMEFAILEGFSEKASLPGVETFRREGEIHVEI